MSERIHSSQFPGRLVVFLLDGQRYALHLAAVQRVIRIAEITPLPAAPPIVAGILNVHGAVVPVVNIRGRFGLPNRETSLSDQIIIARTMRRTIALIVDSVTEVVERPLNQIVTKDSIVPGISYIEGVAKLEDGLILIHDLDAFLSLEEEKALDQATEKTEEKR